MSSTRLTRLSGIVLVAGGIIGVVAFVLDLVIDVLYPHIEDDSLAQATNAPWTMHVTLLFIAALLIVLGLPGLYARLREKSGILGLVGFVLTFVGLITGDVTGAADSAFLQPGLATSAAGRAVLHAGLPSSIVGSVVGFGGGILTLLGSLILGIVIFRAHVLPRWVGVPLIAGVIVFIPAIILGANALGPLLIYAGFGLCGGMLVRRAGTSVPQTLAQPA